MKINQISESGWAYNELRQGCILASIAHAIFIAHNPEFAYEHSWDGFNYSTIDGQGSRGTVTFHKDFFLAGFRNDEFYSDTLNAENYFTQAPEVVMELAEKETLQYLLDNVNGKPIPSITTALWGDKSQVFSYHSFEEMVERGGHLLEYQSLDPETSFEAWEENYELTRKQLSLLKKLYYLKMANPTERIVLSRNDINSIGSNDIEGINESRISFAEIGIEWTDK